MELRHIRYFLMVAEELSFTRAAEKLGIGQPPLSQQVKLLEQEIGARLFRRLSHGVELTQAGKAFRRAVETMPAQAENAAHQARRGAKGELGLLRLGFTGMAGLTSVVSGSIRAFRRAYPDVEVQVEETNSTLLATAVAEDRLDLAFLRPSRSETSGLELDVMLEEPLVAALPARHPLAAGDAALPIALAALTDEGFVLTPRNAGPNLHDATLAACRQAGFEPRIVGLAPQGISVLSLVAAEVGVSLLPISVTSLRLDGLAFRHLDDHSVSVPLALAYRHATTSTLVHNFLRLARQQPVDTARGKPA